jgi:hypothetical protein
VNGRENQTKVFERERRKKAQERHSKRQLLLAAAKSPRPPRRRSAARRPPADSGRSSRRRRTAPAARSGSPSGSSDGGVPTYTEARAAGEEAIREALRDVHPPDVVNDLVFEWEGACRAAAARGEVVSVVVDDGIEEYGSIRVEGRPSITTDFVGKRPPEVL